MPIPRSNDAFFTFVFDLIHSYINVVSNNFFMLQFQLDFNVELYHCLILKPLHML